MGLLGGGNASSTASQSTATTAGASSPSISAGKAGDIATILGDGQVIGSKSNVNYGTDLKAGKDLTINTTTDLGAVNSAFTFAGSALATVQANAAAAGVGANQVTDLLRASIANQANTNSGGAATSSKTFLTTLAIMAGLALIGLIFWKGKKA